VTPRLTRVHASLEVHLAIWTQHRAARHCLGVLPRAARLDGLGDSGRCQHDRRHQRRGPHAAAELRRDSACDAQWYVWTQELGLCVQKEVGNSGARMGGAGCVADWARCSAVV
jgi:hypothetical protein